MKSIFEKKFMTLNTPKLVRNLEASLYQLGWTPEHPRVKSWLKLVAKRINTFEFESLEWVPDKYLERLTLLVHLYYECDELLKKLKMDWEHHDVRAISSTWGYKDKMPLKGYEQLFIYLNDMHDEIIPF